MMWNELYQRLQFYFTSSQKVQNYRSFFLSSTIKVVFLPRNNSLFRFDLNKNKRFKL